MPGTRPRIVIDTNVLVSAMISPGSGAWQAIDFALAQCQILANDETLAELVQVAERHKFDRYASARRRTAFVSRIALSAEIVQTALTVQACRDPRDDKFLALAEAGNAMAIVTGDDDLHSMRAWKGIPIVSPAEFLQKWPAAE